MVDVGFLAKLGRWKDINGVTIVRSLRDFAGRPNRGRVIRLTNLVDVGELQFRFGLRSAGQAKCKAACQAQGQAAGNNGSRGLAE